MGFEEGQDIDPPSGSDIASTLPPVSDHEHFSTAEAHQEAEPGNMAPGTNGAILDTLSASADAEDKTAFDVDQDSTPPLGPNQ